MRGTADFGGKHRFHTTNVHGVDLTWGRVYELDVVGRVLVECRQEIAVVAVVMVVEADENSLLCHFILLGAGMTRPLQTRIYFRFLKRGGVSLRNMVCQ